MNDQNIYDTVWTLLFIALAGWLVWRWMKAKIKFGNIIIGKNVYSYTIGDDIVAKWLLNEQHVSKFNGINIALPKTLPHIYLDSHHDDRLSGPRFYIPRKHKVSLEGDFDKYFQLYAPEGYKQLALSIISPDVMLTMIDSAHRFDIEIHGTNLRLISQKPIFNKASREDAIIKATNALLKEIDHKLKSWSAQNSLKAENAVLPVKHESTLKVGRHTIRLAWVYCFFISLIFASSWTISSLFGRQEAGYKSPDLFYWLGLLIIFISPFIVVFVYERYVIIQKDISDKIRWYRPKR